MLDCACHHVLLGCGLRSLNLGRQHLEMLGPELLCPAMHRLIHVDRQLLKVTLLVIWRGNRLVESGIPPHHPCCNTLLRLTTDDMLLVIVYLHLLD